MLKQWLLNDGKTDSITVEEKYSKWVEQLRSDRYVTVPGHAIRYASELHVLCMQHSIDRLMYMNQVTKLQLYKIYGKSKEAKAFIDELCRGS